MGPIHSYDRVPPCVDDYYRNRNHSSIIIVGRMLVIFAADPKYLPHLDVL